jgi:diguanylate cyclase (GGDEF)-like protein/PAS domain S-box-containing protein
MGGEDAADELPLRAPQRNECGELVDRGTLFALVPAPCLVLTPDLVICDVNEAYLRATGRTREELVGQPMFDAFPENPADPGADGVRNLRASLERARDGRVADVMAVQKYDIPVAGGAPGQFEERYWSPINVPVPDADGSTAFLIHQVEDVTETLRAQRRLAARERRFRALVEYASDGIVLVSADGVVVYASPAMSRILGAAPSAVIRSRWPSFVHPDDVGPARSLVAEAVATPGETVTARFRVQASDGSVRWLDARATSHLGDPEIAGTVVNVRDVTGQAEARLEAQALQDPLTGMPNRRAFSRSARQALARAARSNLRVALILIDVDNFKRINDSLGHPAGDRLLIELAERVSRALRPGDVVARLGGDEFVLLAEDLQSDHDALAIARRVAEAATGRYALGPGLRPRVTLSMGVSGGGAELDADTLLAQADAALYDAKRGGRDRIAVFDPALRAELDQRIRLEHDLHGALDRQELLLHWQPIVDARSGAALGAEALLRWQHPERGLLGPGEFLPVAEESGLMPQLGGWAVERALDQAAGWPADGGPRLVFVNLAGAQLSAPGLVEHLADVASATGIDPGRVRLEVSERILMADVGRTRDVLRRLHDRGFGVVLDDFGAGNTSLAWLQELPIDMLKLDRRFVASIDEPATRAIVAALTRLAPALGVSSVAEGVETAEQLRVLAEIGCDYAQGFHIARPEPAELARRRFMRRAG